jgi:ABC-type polysaccharide/polyol phosphate export permease
MVYPLSVVASKLVDLVLSLIPFTILAIVLGRPPTAAWIFVVPALVLATLFSAGLSVLFSSLTVFYRDMRHLVDILIQVWFYLTPVLYPASFLEKLPYPGLRWALQANPATPIIRCFQVPLYEGRAPEPALLGWATLAACAVFAVGVATFTAREAEHIHHF